MRLGRLVSTHPYSLVDKFIPEDYYCRNKMKLDNYIGPIELHQCINQISIYLK